ncbi:putative serine esterase (DUF676) [Geosmithia morbida]|uniref:Serine esterase (DUF676) n=1 Tax=Geosmithia morbida TaxID=1094350 RepID=A0A9P5D5W2_9HYPO|nr:putative serine esterase (DUF676) [Geosmithia morbida]KAF4124981.1 putative serine esterase (DUF676) [Geosmithia morbida]
MLQFVHRCSTAVTAIGVSTTDGSRSLLMPHCPVGVREALRKRACMVRLAHTEVCIRRCMDVGCGHLRGRGKVTSRPNNGYTVSAVEAPPPSEAAGSTRGALGLSLVYSPPDPKIDIIMVHGLAGDSRKTWSKGHSPSSFWPLWLTKEPAIMGRGVRISTFGYDSRYLKGSSGTDCMGIHQFGMSLLTEIATSPYIRGAGTRIITIGHSMGGLVAKRAFIGAVRDPEHRDIARRFASMYFLATPHRGADSARLLGILLRAVALDKAYVGDLERNSAAVRTINDDFFWLSSRLDIRSFYETEIMSHFRSLIVDKSSAIMDLVNEFEAPMSADHRSICKFASTHDNNYRILRNSLVATLENLMPMRP